MSLNFCSQTLAISPSPVSHLISGFHQYMILLFCDNPFLLLFILHTNSHSLSPYRLLGYLKKGIRIKVSCFPLVPISIFSPRRRICFAFLLLGFLLYSRHFIFQNSFVFSLGKLRFPISFLSSMPLVGPFGSHSANY